MQKEEENEALTEEMILCVCLQQITKAKGKSRGEGLNSRGHENLSEELHWVTGQGTSY